MLYFLIPVYNEELNIELLAKSLINFQTKEDKFFVFVDDCSTDSSIDFINNFFSGENIEIIKKEKNGGPGDSFNKGFNWILENTKSNNDKVITLEADNTSDIGILHKMLVISNLGYDLVLASVYAQGGELVNTSFFRKILSVFANFFIRIILDLKVLTLSSFYRVYDISLLKKIKDNFHAIVVEEGFISKVEILHKAVRVGASVIEVPMKLNSDNRQGKSKMKVFKTGVSYLKYMLKSKRKK